MIFPAINLRLYEGFHSYGVPNSWMVYNGTSVFNMDDEIGYPMVPLFQESSICVGCIWRFSKMELSQNHGFQY